MVSSQAIRFSNSLLCCELRRFANYWCFIVCSVFFFLICLYVSCCCNKIPWQKKLKWIRIYLTHKSRWQSITIRQTRQQWLRAVKFITAAVKDREQWIKEHVMGLTTFLLLLDLSGSLFGKWFLTSFNLMNMFRNSCLVLPNTYLRVIAKD